MLNLRMGCKKIIPLLLLANVIVLLMQSCEKNSVHSLGPDPIANCAKTIKNYFPLAVGNEWIYQIQKRTVMGVVETTYTFSRRVIRRIDSLGIALFDVFDSRGQIPPNSILLGITDSTVIGYFINNISKSDTILKKPLVSGNKWNVNHPTCFRIDSTEGKISTPAGNFENCLLVSEIFCASSGFSSTKYYYAPCGGLVYYTYFDESSITEMKLISKNF